MRLSELLGLPVHEVGGAQLGGVADLVLLQDGPILAGHTASLRVAGLIVVRRRHAHLLGYERDLRPVMFRSIVRALAGDVWRVAWSDVDEVTAEGVWLRVGAGDLEQHHRSKR